MAQTSVFVLTPDFPAVEGCEMISGSYEEVITTAKRMGYDGVEITMGDPGQFDAGAFQKLLDENSMKVSAINSGGIQYLFQAALVSDDDRKVSRALDLMKQFIRHSQTLGCIQQIGVARGFGVAGRSMRWFKDALVEALKDACSFAENLGVPVVFEYTNRFEINTINTGVEAKEIVERVGRPNLGILVDTYHSYIEDPDVGQNLRNLNGHIRHFHLHDSNRGPATVSGGENDFDRILRICGEIGYHGWFSDGLLTMRYPESVILQSTGTLRRLYAHYGL